MRMSEYQLVQVRRVFTLYFIPLIPMGVAGKYVECMDCGESFAEEILDYDPEEERKTLQTRMLRVMILAAFSDEHIDNAERNVIKDQYIDLFGIPVSPKRLEKEIEIADSSNATLNTYVRKIGGELSPHGKALVIKLAMITMRASGKLSREQWEDFDELGETLDIPEDEFKALIEHIRETEGI